MVDSDTSYRSTCSRRMRCSSRSNGPSYTAVLTSYGIALHSSYNDVVPGGAAANCRTRWVRTTPTIPIHGTRLFRHQANGERDPRQSARGAAALGRGSEPGRVLLRRRSPRLDHPSGPGRAPAPDAEPGHHAARGRARPGHVHALRTEPRPRAHRTG